MTINNAFSQYDLAIDLKGNLIAFSIPRQNNLDLVKKCKQTSKKFQKHYGSMKGRNFGKVSWRIPPLIQICAIIRKETYCNSLWNIHKVFKELVPKL